MTLRLLPVLLAAGALVACSAGTPSPAAPAASSAPVTASAPTVASANRPVDAAGDRACSAIRSAIRRLGNDRLDPDRMITISRQGVAASDFGVRVGSQLLGDRAELIFAMGAEADDADYAALRETAIELEAACIQGRYLARS